MRHPDVHIVIVSYNCASALRNCLNSIPQALHPYRGEVVVVDNASGDDSVSMVSQEFSEVQIVDMDSNRGFAAATNRGLLIGQARHFLLLNPDTIPTPGSLAELVRFLDSHPVVAAVGPALTNNARITQPSVRSFPNLWTLFTEATGLQKAFPGNSITGHYRMEYMDLDSPAKVDQPSGACLMVRGEALNEVGLLCEEFFMYYEEVDWCKRAYVLGWEIWYWPRAKVVHLGGVSAEQAFSESLTHMYHSRCIWFRKHIGSWVQVLVVAASVVELLLKISYWGVQYAMRKNDNQKRIVAYLSALLALLKRQPRQRLRKE